MLEPKLRVKIAETNTRQKQIAEDLEIKQQRLSNWVNGKGFPNLNEAFKLAKYFNCKVDDLWEYKDEKGD